MRVLWGKVRRGKNRGKKLSFPTANIALHQKIPEGVYIAKTKVHSRWYQSLAFIGAAKTFNEKTYHAETYILNFNESLYGQWITIKLLKKIRGNKKFASVNNLVKQMQEDEKEARKYFS